MKNGSGADNRKYRINRALLQATPIKPTSFDMTQMDDTPFETPHCEQSIGSDFPGRINRRLDFEEQEEIELMNEPEQHIETIKKETVQHLEQLQPKRRRIDVDAKVSTRKYLDRICEIVSINQAKEDVTKEFQQYERASGSNDPQMYDKEDPGASHPPKGKRGRPVVNKPKQVKDMERIMRQEIAKGFQEIE